MSESDTNLILNTRLLEAKHRDDSLQLLDESDYYYLKWGPQSYVCATLLRDLSWRLELVDEGGVSPIEIGSELERGLLHQATVIDRPDSALPPAVFETRTVSDEEMANLRHCRAIREVIDLLFSNSDKRQSHGDETIYGTGLVEGCTWEIELARTTDDKTVFVNIRKPGEANPTCELVLEHEGAIEVQDEQEWRPPNPALIYFLYQALSHFEVTQPTE